MNKNISMKIKITHSSGDVLYPCKMQNRDTGKIAFRLSKRGNKKSDSIEIESEEEMIKMVTTQGFMVRARTLKSHSQGGRMGLYRLNERSIVDHVIK